MPLQFEDLREQLLHAGIAPRHVNRYITELREHLADLVAQERAAGADEAQAQARARTLLGADEQLATAMIEQGAPRSLAARAPWSVFALLPVMLLLAVICGAGFILLHVLLPIRGLAPSEMPAAYLALIITANIVCTWLLGPLLSVACVLVALRQRLHTHWLWIGLALIAVLSALLGFNMHVIAAADGHGGGAFFSATSRVYVDGRVDVAATLIISAVRAVGLFVLATIAYRMARSRLTPARM